MAYEKKGFTDGVTPLDAEHFNHIEDGIVALSEEIAGLKENSGSDAWDAVITWDNGEGSTNIELPVPTDEDFSKFTVAAGSSANIVAKLMAGDIPKIKLAAVPKPAWDGADVYLTNVISPVQVQHDGDLGTIYIYFRANVGGNWKDMRIALYTDSDEIKGITVF